MHPKQRDLIQAQHCIQREQNPAQDTSQELHTQVDSYHL